MHGLRKRQKKPGKREIRSISLKKQTEKNKKQKTGLTKEEKKRLKELRMIKAENQKKRKPFTAQDTIPYKEIYKDGICRTDDNYYSKMVQFYDINYQLAQNDDKAAIFENYCEFLNSFDSSVEVQITFLNQQVNFDEYAKNIDTPEQDDCFNDIRKEYSDMLKMQLSKGNNGLVKTKYITFSIVTLVLLVALITSFNYFKTTNTYIDDSFNNQTKITKGISMNLEQTAGAGDYKTVTQRSWPTEGYRFNTELSRCENGSTLSWDDTKKAVIVSGNLSDKCYVYFDKVVSLAEYVKSLYTGTQGDNALYYHNSTLTNGAGDNSYRYAGASDSVNNYICLGSDAATCPDANLFRIIGVFGDQTKVIRAKSVGDQKWHTSADNTWSSSSLNTYLNGEYLTSLGTIADKIATTTWKVGGGSWSNIVTSVPKTAYQYEVGSSASTTTYDAKIGLMYVSDYGFAADQSGWTTKLSSYNSNSSKNWLYLGSNEWTISRDSGTTNYAFYVRGTGSVDVYSATISYAVRPSFNLESSVKYVSGSGSMSDPVRVN